MHPLHSSADANRNRKSFGRNSESVESKEGDAVAIYSFGHFRLDLRLRRLMEGEEIVPLQQKPFRVLTHLIQNRSRVVPQAELIDLFWDGQHVYQDSLRRAVSSIRSALKDKREQPRFLETHHGEGYRFIAAVEETRIEPHGLESDPTSGDELDLEVPPPTDAAAPSGLRRSSWRNGWGRSLSSARSAPGAIFLHLAGVLGITAVLLVADSHRLRHPAGTNQTPVVTANSFAGPRDAGKGDAYHEAQYLLSQRNSASIQQAINTFNEILKSNAGAGDAYAGLAECYALGYWGFWKIDPDLAVQMSVVYAQQGVRADPGSAYAHAQLAAALFRQLKIGQAQSEFERALAIRPSDAEVHHAYGVFLDDTHRADDGIEEMKRAIELEPLSLAYKTDLGMSYYFAMRYADAIAQYRSVLKLDPNYIEAHEYLASMYVYQARWAEARAEYAATDRLGGARAGDFRQSPLRLITEFKTGGEKKARMGVEAILAAPSVTHSYALARIYAQLGRPEDALRYLSQVVNSHNLEMLTVPDDPPLVPLHGNPEFEVLANRASAVFTPPAGNPIQAATLVIPPMLAGQ